MEEFALAIMIFIPGLVITSSLFFLCRFLMDIEDPFYEETQVFIKHEIEGKVEEDKVENEESKKNADIVDTAKEVKPLNYLEQYYVKYNDKFNKLSNSFVFQEDDDKVEALAYERHLSQLNKLISLNIRSYKDKLNEFEELFDCMSKKKTMNSKSKTMNSKSKNKGLINVLYFFNYITKDEVNTFINDTKIELESDIESLNKILYDGGFFAEIEDEDEYDNDKDLYIYDGKSIIGFNYLYIYEQLSGERQKCRLLYDYYLNYEKDENKLRELAYEDKLSYKRDKLINSYLLETTPVGNVYMRYNNRGSKFEYYSTHTIPYAMLESIAKKYVLTFLCKPVFIDAKYISKEKVKMPVITTKRSLKEMEIYKAAPKNREMRETIVPQNIIKANVNANANEYINPNENINVKLNKYVKTEVNVFTWVDRLSNFNPLQKVNIKKTFKTYNMSYADYKKNISIK